MTRALRGSFALPLLLSLGCSTSTGSAPPGSNGPVGGAGNVGGRGNLGGGYHYSETGGSTSSSTIPADIDSGCAGDSIAAQLTQVNILILLDKSGSMGDQFNSSTGDYDWRNCESRWNPVVSTLKEFFSDADSGRLYASLSFLPADGDEYTMCTASKYTTSASLKVSLTQLDDTGRKKFLDKLCDCGEGITMASTCIKPSGGTPTLPALQGTIDYAAKVSADFPKSKTVIVMLTDGEPGFGFNFNGQIRHVISCGDLPPKGCTTGCGCVDDNLCGTQDLADAEVEKVRRVIESAPEKSIHVAGVGASATLSTATLETWAAASGNDPIDLLDKSSAEAAATLRARLEAIRESSISCEFSVPPSKTGAAIDPDKTNVSYTPGSGSAAYLSRTFDGTSASCGTSMNSWYFDNPKLPTTIKLCPETCKALQSDPKGAIQVVYGCKTIVPIM